MRISRWPALMVGMVAPAGSRRRPSCDAPSHVAEVPFRGPICRVGGGARTVAPSCTRPGAALSRALLHRFVTIAR
jgi:hypothetical protein